MWQWVTAVILFLFLWAIVPDLALKISARFVFLKSCAVNKNWLFLSFLFSVWIPPHVLPDWKRGSKVLLNFRQISQRHGRSIDEWSIKVLTALALMACYHNSHTPSLMCRRRAGHSAPRRRNPPATTMRWNRRGRRTESQRRRRVQVRRRQRQQFVPPVDCGGNY